MTVTEVVLILQVSFLTVGSKQKITINTQNTMLSSDHSKARSTKNKGVMFFFCLGHGLSYYFPMFSEAKVTTVNSELTKFIDVQCSHENIKLCISNKV